MTTLPVLSVRRCWRRFTLCAAAAGVAAAIVACGGSGAGAGNPGPATGAPVVSFSQPADFGSGFTGTLTVTADASDAVAVAGVEFMVDGAPVGPADSAPPYSVSVDTSAYPAGQHVLRARAIDNEGNRSAWATRTVRFGTRTEPAGFTRNTSFVTGLNNATAFAQAPDGRLFIAEQGGTLRVVKNGALLPTPFLTVTANVDASGERGLLGVALHPNFANNGFVYVYYTSTAGGIHNRISRFTAVTAGADVAAAGSELVLIDLPTLGAANHNGGAIHFGSDGKLYAGVGDNTVGANSQNLASPLGKLLRLEDNGTVPLDNPFAASQQGQGRYVWAYGLRNPFTFAVQPGSGRIHINDVGESTWEEINLGARGANYGWPGSEGPDGVSAGTTAPLFAYKHSDASPPGSGPGGFFTGQAITGGAFYPTSGAFPAAYRGNYFFADLTSRFIAVLDLANDNTAFAFGSVGSTPVDLLAAGDGALLVLTRNGVVRFSAP